MTSMISVLFVEDDEDVRTVSAGLLTLHGDITVIGVSSAEEAIDLLRTRSVDVIISDYEMPGMDGIAFLKYLKGQGDVTPFILFTGKSREDIAIEALNNGAAFYLQKGEAVKAIFTELEGKIRSAAAHHRAIEDLQKKNEEISQQYAALQQSKEELKNTTDLLENLIHITQTPILVWDPSFIIIRLNHACEVLTGRQAEELIGLPVEALFSPDLDGRKKKLLQAIADGARWERTELDIRHLDGSRKKILWNTSTLYASDGITPIATIAQGNDVTDEIRLKREKDTALEQIQKNLAQLAFLNDEIRNPLMVISMCADQHATAERIELIISQVSRIDEMVNNLDKRWAESETVLQMIRRHYQIDPVDVSDPGSEEVHPVARISEDGTSLVEEVKARLFTILDSIDAFVYVADMDTYELLYTNRQGRAMLGNIIGKRCFQALHPGVEKPCQFCTNQFLTADGVPTGVYRWEFQNDEDGKWYDCRDRAIRWSDGRIVHLTISTDITERRESETRYRSFIENAPEGVFLADEKGDYIFVNDAACTITGYSREELLSKNLIDLTFPEDIPKAGDHFQKVAHSGRGSGSLRFLTKEGDVRWWAVKAVRLSPDRFLGFTSDITAQKQAEEALLESEEKYRLLHENAGIGIGYYSPDGIVISYNLVAAANMGGNPEDFVGKSLFDLFPEEDAQRYIARIQEAAESDKPVIYEDLVSLPTGDNYFLSTWTRITGSAGNVVGIQIISQNITLRRRAEEALATSEAKYRNLFSNAILGIFRTTPQGQYLDMNPAFARIFGYDSSEEMMAVIHDIGRQLYVRPEDRVKIGQLLTRNGEIRNYDAEVLHRDGHSVWIAIHATSVKSETGSELWWEGTIEDITARKRAESDLTRKNEELRVAYEQIAATSEELRQNYEELTIAGVALTMSEEKFRRLSEDMPVCISTFLPDGTLTYVNNALSDLTGLPPERLIGYSFFDMLSPEDRLMVTRQISSLSRANPVEVHEQTHPDKGGSERIVQWINRGFFDEDGNAVSFQAAGIDITAHRKAEQEYKTLFHEMLDGMAIHEIICDKAGVPVDYRFLAVNPAFERLTGIHAGDIVGRRVLEVLPGTERYWIETYGNVALSGEPVCFEQYHAELGKYFEVTAFRPASGQFACIFQDITQRKQAEEALMHGLELLNESQQITKSGGWEWDVTQQTMTWTDETYRIHGMTPGQSVSGSPELIDWSLACYDPVDRPVIRDAFLCCLRQGKSYDLSFPLTRTDGVRIWVRTMAHAVMDEGRIVRVIGNIMDITDLKQAEAALRESERSYREIFNSTSEAIMIDDLSNGKIIDLNETTLRMYGYETKEEIIAGNIGDLSANIPPYDEEQAQKRIQKCIEEGHHIFEWLAKKKNGELFWTEVSLQRSEIGGEGRVLAVVRDISLRKQIEEQLRASEERLMQIDSSTKDAIYAYDHEGRFIHANRALCDLLGLSREEIIGKNHEELGFPKEKCLEWNALHEEVYATNSTITRETVTPIQGSEDLFFEVVLNPIHDKTGAVVGISGITRNITERRRAEDHLRESDARFRLVIKASSICVFSQDTNLRYTWIYNPGPGVSPEGSIGKTDAEILPQKEAEILTAIKKQVLESGKGTRQYVRITLGGRTFDYDLTIEPLQDLEGSITGIICASLDISELKHTEEALLSSNQKLRLLTSLTRHDINNTLNAIHLLHEMASGESDPQKKSTYIKNTYQAIQTAESIIQFTKEYEEFGIVASRWQNVHLLIRDASFETIHSGILVEVTIHPDLQIFADPIIRKVFSTLIENSVRHAGILTKIEFSCRKTDSSIIIVCEDDGVGIPLDEKECIFEHGYGKHTGIGLFITREILAITGLSIREAGVPGFGARFEILVPDGKWRISKEDP